MTAVASPVLLSFFCAGVPSQFATDDLVATLVADRGDVASVRYRGNGWPGSFVVQEAGGATRSTSYEDSWGNHLGRRLQERCKICPDGTGGHADIAVGDYWHADASGFPLFDDADGLSVAIARTERGHRLLMRSRDAGVIGLEPVELDAVAAVQPLQVKRRRTLLGRLAGRRLAARAIPRYRGFGLLKLAVSSPSDSVRAARGTFSGPVGDGRRWRHDSVRLRLRRELGRSMTATRLMEVRTKGARFAWMDLLRGSAIFMLILYHASAIASLYGRDLPRWLVIFNEFFLPFRMPTLMFLSGMLLSGSLRKPLVQYYWGKPSTSRIHTSSGPWFIRTHSDFRGRCTIHGLGLRPDTCGSCSTSGAST